MLVAPTFVKFVLQLTCRIKSVKVERVPIPVSINEAKESPIVLDFKSRNNKVKAERLPIPVPIDKAPGSPIELLENHKYKVFKA